MSHPYPEKPEDIRSVSVELVMKTGVVCQSCWISRMMASMGWGKTGESRFVTPREMQPEGESSNQLDPAEEPLDPSLTTFAPKKDRPRETWSGKFEFFLTCMGYCVGFGNIWRFPFLVYRNGGGAFLIPYIIFLVLCGIPLVFMEMAMGQFSSLTAIHLFGNFSPLLKGLAYSMVMISAMVTIYYSNWKLPWSYCDPLWASSRCFSPSETVDRALLFTGNSSIEERSVSKDRRLHIPAAEEYWNRHVLRLSQGIETIGDVRVELLICLLLAWICVFFCSCKGIRTTGKVVYFTATFPFLMLVVLLIRGCTLPGAIDGIKLFIYPDFSRLWEFRVWIDAAMQIFYAMAPGWGGLLSFASFNDFHVDIYKYGIVIPVLNLVTSLIGGFAVFSVIGFLSYESGIEPSSVVAQGPGLTFVVYPSALAQLPAAPVWAVIFFATLFTVGIDSQFGMFETVLSAMSDEFAVVKRHRVLFCGAACSVLFLLGIVCVTESGMYWVQIIDWYCAFLTLLVICLLECFLIGWVYGADRFRRDINFMIGYSVNRLWCFTWKFVTPFTILVLLMCSFYFQIQEPIVYEKYKFPGWSVAVGWMLAISSLLPIPAYAVYKLVITDGSLISRIKRTVKPSTKFGPLKPEDRQEYLEEYGLSRPAGDIKLVSSLAGVKCEMEKLSEAI